MLTKNSSHKVWEMLTWVILLTLLMSGCNGGSAESKTYRVGLLSGIGAFNDVIDAFKTQMTEYGYIEGENISYIYKEANSDTEAMKQIAEEFVSAKVDMIVTTSNGAAEAAKAATAGTDIPVVFTIVTGADTSGLVNSLRQPGGNLTGVSQPPASYHSKRVEYLAKMVPDAETFLVFYDPEYGAAAASAPFVKEACAALGINLVEKYIKSADEITNELNVLAAQEDPGVDAILIMPDPYNNPAAQAIIDFGLPVSANTSGQTELGGLFSYASSNSQTGQAAAVIADKVLKGANPGDLPVETAAVFLTINLKASDRLGITVPDDLLGAAQNIIR